MFKKIRMVHEEKLQFGKCNKVTPKPGAGGRCDFNDYLYTKEKKYTTI
jgi:hypothetical protein